MRHVATGLAVMLLTATRQARAESEDSWWGEDKALHFGASAAIAAGAYGVSTLVFDEAFERAIVGGSVALAAGLAKEAYDLTGAGTASYKDLTWDVAGAAFGVGVALLVDALVSGDSGAPAETRGAGLVNLRF